MPSTMSPQKRKRLESKGWKVGGPKGLLDLSEKPVAAVELRLKSASKGESLASRRTRNPAKVAVSAARPGSRSAVQSKLRKSAGSRPDRGRHMEQNYKAVIKRSGKWWIGWVQEVPGVNCQEKTRSALLESLRVTLEEALKFNRAEARRAAGKGYEELTIAI